MKNFFKKLFCSDSMSKHFSETVKRVGKNNAGFSLVELIVVIAIMAILAAVAVIGVSVYIPHSQKAADEQLAADVQKAMDLALLSDSLTVGDYVVIKHNARAEYGNNNGGNGATANAAMIATFGDDWQNDLSLAYADWEIGVIADSEKMEYVNNSSFNGSGLNTMLGQVQNVVNVAGNYFDGTTITDETLLDYLDKTGVQLGDGNVVNSGDGSAVANTTVFYVANSISQITDTEAYLEAWFLAACTGDASSLQTVLNGDPFSAYSTAYAAVLGVATYVDSKTSNSANPTDFVGDLEMDVNDSNLTALQTKLSSVAASIGTDCGDYAREYYALDLSSGQPNYESSQMKTDAMAFIAYMDGVEKSSDSMISGNDIYSDNYFNDGTVHNYVKNYMDVSTVLSSLNISAGAFVFIYDGTQIVCVPLDY